MQVITPQFIQDKIVLLRLDIDVPLRLRSGSLTSFEVVDDFRLKAGLPTLKLCLENAQKVIVLGHIGRPEGKEVPGLSVAPILEWLEDNLDHHFLEEEKLFLLENLRFEKGESFDTAQDREEVMEYAKDLISLADPDNTGSCVFINEAFASYHDAASTTVLPTLLPHAVGLRFAQEVEKLIKVRENPQKPLIAIIGGAKVDDKLPVVLALSKIADAVLVGGKLPQEIKEKNIEVPSNVLVGKLNEKGTDIAPETVDSWKKLIETARMIVWNGPVGQIQNSKFKIQNLEGIGSERGTYEIAKMITESRVESIVGGGDTVGFLSQAGLLDKFSFISTGGGAMLKFLETGTLPTIEALLGR